MTEDQIRRTFAYHTLSPNQRAVIDRIRSLVTEAAVHVAELVPDSRERSLCITHMQTAMMMANAGVAIHDVVDTTERAVYLNGKRIKWSSPTADHRRLCAAAGVAADGPRVKVTWQYGSGPRKPIFPADDPVVVLKGMVFEVKGGGF